MDETDSSYATNAEDDNNTISILYNARDFQELDTQMKSMIRIRFQIENLEHMCAQSVKRKPGIKISKITLNITTLRVFVFLATFVTKHSGHRQLHSNISS